MTAFAAPQKDGDLASMSSKLWKAPQASNHIKNAKELAFVYGGQDITRLSVQTSLTA